MTVPQHVSPLHALARYYIFALRVTHHLITTGVADLLPHQLVDPLGLAPLGGVDTRYDQRHDEQNMELLILLGSGGSLKRKVI